MSRWLSSTSAPVKSASTALGTPPSYVALPNPQSPCTSLAASAVMLVASARAFVLRITPTASPLLRFCCLRCFVLFCYPTTLSVVESPLFCSLPILVLHFSLLISAFISVSVRSHDNDKQQRQTTTKRQTTTTNDKKRTAQTPKNKNDRRLHARTNNRARRAHGCEKSTHAT